MSKHRLIHHQVRNAEIEGLEKIRKAKEKREKPFPRNLRQSIQHDLDYRGMKVIVPKKPETILSEISIQQDLSASDRQANPAHSAGKRSCGVTKTFEEARHKERRKERRQLMAAAETKERLRHVERKKSQ